MTTFGRAVVIYIVFMILLVLALVVMLTEASDAHEWYEFYCCGAGDCHPVKDGVVNDAMDGGVDVQGYGHIRADSTKLRDSQDLRDHICVHNDNLMCVYHVHRSF